MLLIAPSTAGGLVPSVEMTVRLGCLFGVVFVIVGPYRTFEFDTPSGPTIMAIPGALYAATPNNRVVVKNPTAGNHAICGFRG